MSRQGRGRSRGGRSQESGAAAAAAPADPRQTLEAVKADPRLRGLLPMDLIDLVAGAGLNYDALGESGSVFHLLGCLSEHGKLGMTCIGRSAQEAEQVYARTKARLLGDH